MDVICSFAGDAMREATGGLKIPSAPSSWSGYILALRGVRRYQVQVEARCLPHIFSNFGACGLFRPSDSRKFLLASARPSVLAQVGSR
eukprot:6480561-Amphidinium_carterae.1